MSESGGISPPDSTVGVIEKIGGGGRISSRRPHVYDVSTRELMLVDFSLDVSRVEEMVSQGAAGLS